MRRLPARVAPRIGALCVAALSAAGAWAATAGAWSAPSAIYSNAAPQVLSDSVQSSSGEYRNQTSGLGPAEQAKYLGVQSMCWNAGPILANGVLIRASGMLHKDSGSWHQAWMVVLLIIAGLMAALAIYHVRMLPPGAKAPDAPKSVTDGLHTFALAFTTFFKKKDGEKAMLDELEAEEKKKQDEDMVSSVFACA